MEPFFNFFNIPFHSFSTSYPCNFIVSTFWIRLLELYKSKIYGASTNTIDLCVSLKYYLKELKCFVIQKFTYFYSFGVWENIFSYISFKG